MLPKDMWMAPMKTERQTLWRPGKARMMMREPWLLHSFAYPTRLVLRSGHHRCPGGSRSTFQVFELSNGQDTKLPLSLCPSFSIAGGAARQHDETQQVRSGARPLSAG